MLQVNMNDPIVSNFLELKYNPLKTSRANFQRAEIECIIHTFIKSGPFFKGVFP